MARHPLAYPAPFDPWLPLDIWSWILTATGFAILTALILTSHMMLRRMQSTVMNRIYYATDYWKEAAWFKTSSLLLFLWGFTFNMFSNFYQIDFRTGLISQTLESPVESWSHIDLFTSHFYMFSMEKLSLVTKVSFLSHKNLLEQDRYFYRYRGVRKYRIRWGFWPLCPSLPKSCYFGASLIQNYNLGIAKMSVNPKNPLLPNTSVYCNKALGRGQQFNV